MAASVLDLVQSHLEQVATDVAEYYSFDTELAGQIKPAKVAEATRYLYRQIVKLWSGGVRQKITAERGDLGSGNGPKVIKLTGGYIDSDVALEMTQEQVDLSKTSTQARIQITSAILTDAFKLMNAWDNIDLHGDGSGKLTNAASTGTSTTLTFAATTDTLGINRLANMEGQSVDVWDSTGATKRAGGPYQISAIDYTSSAPTVTFASAPTAMGTTDLIAVAAADVYGPSTLVTASSTWPGGGLTNAPGLTGDSWRHGLAYCNDATSSNYYMGQLKSTYPQLMPVRVNASSNALTFSHGELAKNLLIRRRGKDALNGMQWIMEQNQHNQLKEIALTLGTIMSAPGENIKMTDVMPSGNYGDVFYFAGIPAKASRHQDKARVDGFNPSNWGRVEGFPAQFHTDPDGKMRWFEPRSTTTGNPLAAWACYLRQKFDWVNKDPGASMFIDSLSVLSGY